MLVKKTLALVSLSLSLLPSAWASVLAIDYGTDWTKASLMKPGVPFDVLLGKDSKRKIHASVGWNRDDRLFSTDAFNIVSSSSYKYNFHTLGWLNYFRGSPGYTIPSGLVPLTQTHHWFAIRQQQKLVLYPSRTGRCA